MTKQKISIELEVESKENAMFLHTEIGTGKYGKKEVRLIQATDGTLIVQEYINKNNWISHIIPIKQLSEKLIKALVKD